MLRLIEGPTKIESEGTKPKTILEYVGRVNSSSQGLSVAHMKSPPGWMEPGQTPEFDEYTLVLQGRLQVESRTETLLVSSGQAIVASAGEWVRYSTPEPEGCEYIAVCLPAFGPDLVHRDANA